MHAVVRRSQTYVCMTYGGAASLQVGSYRTAAVAAAAAAASLVAAIVSLLGIRLTSS